MLGIGSEMIIFLSAAVSGMTVWFAACFVNRIRVVFRFGKVRSGICDLLFWAAVSMYVFRQMYQTTYGDIRWFFVLGIAIGLLAGGGCSAVIKKVGVKFKKTIEKKKKSG